MLTLKRLMVVVLAAVLLAGCAGVKMTPMAEQALRPLAADQSRVQFFRSSFVGSAIAASVYDVTGEEVEFLGILNNDTRIIVDRPPGKRTFMVVSEAADYMHAELDPGLTYYSIITPRMGMWKARFSMWPVRNGAAGEYQIDSSEFAEWMRETQVMGLSSKARGWFELNKEDVLEKHAKYWPVWLKKSPQDLDERTLHGADGVKR
ncbi:hypothetical protein [Aestuariirhabdus litorea]|uniref:DUF2846 domain-containing protein n=1 Tax=Aestuariirhabdus litorea TaxID=2528527 RepID=A0A3P3VQY4_9GAMM|nr:hypothetical protein [Aestuariirhabdus litorea]RRJ83233.1 hypothetical protein D0544_15480 [Aestuariirhabdus litorea]RWW93390.1 hypothetical protein DZC74_15450 [Endozoicomonadaceae bacterium GTF-13]